MIKNGTLRNSCQNYIEARLRDLFSGLIALIDTNNNLDLLANPGSQFTDFWLRVFDNPELLEINYRSYLLADNIEKSEFFSGSANCAADLKFRLPFSWVIKRKIDQIVGSKITNNENHTENDMELYNQLNSVFQTSELNEKLGRFLSEDKLVNAYINDYLLMAADVSDQPLVMNKNHMNVIIKRLREYSKRAFRTVNLVSLTLSCTVLKNEIELFSKFVNFSPEVSLTKKKLVSR